MAIIITNQNVANDCHSCDLSYGVMGYGGRGFNCCTVTDEDVDPDDHEKPESCPVKSVEGLIALIENEKRDGRDAEHSTSFQFDTGIDTAIKIIKKYCEMEE